MGYAQHIRQKKFHQGALLAARFPAGGSISIQGCLPLPRTNAQDELADVHAQMLLEGTTKYTKRQLQEKLDAMGASLNFDYGDSRLNFSARVRSRHTAELLELIAHILRQPSFPKEELAVLKRREEANLSLAAQNTRGQAQAALARMLFRKDHPNYEHTVPALRKSLKNINASVLHAFHKKLSASRLVCAIVGDIEPAKAFVLMRTHFETLPHRRVAPSAPKLASLPKAQKTVAHIIHKQNIDYMVGIAARINNMHKDFAPLLLGLKIFGNPGFTSRLMDIIREQEGLTYVVYSYPVNFSGRKDGYLMTWGSFSPQLFARGRAAILREISRIVAEGVSDEEVRKHRDAFEANTRVSLANSGALARMARNMIADGKPLKEIDEFPRRMMRLSTDEVNAALKKYLHPNKLAEAAAGPVEKF